MELTEIPLNTSGSVYRSAMPYSTYDRGGDLIPEYKDRKISWIIMLSSDEEVQRITGYDLRQLYRSEGFDILYLPIPDFGTPDMVALRDMIQKALSISQSGKGLVIHCHAGLGRTGMFVACLAKEGLDYSSEEAIKWIRDLIPGAVEDPEQEMIVRSF
ncbi:MAG: dual specificity protein phosphatase family protein [Chloroflexota bacterium]|nr:MAG: dual specificity protein phosphatase family protein [Chloroflexota bacterium]